jgi:hypothetical protein
MGRERFLVEAIITEPTTDGSLAPATCSNLLRETDRDVRAAARRPAASQP